MNIFKLNQSRIVEDPQFVKILFSDVRFSILWLIARIWLGWQWVSSATGKIGVEGWTGDGSSLRGFWERAVAIPETGRPLITFDWYRNFIQSLLDAEAYTWFASLVAYGELLVGIALIIGAFTGFAAFFGAFMNFNFMLAGSASSNPVLFVIALLLMFAWKTAGFIGADFFLLRWLGTPWGRQQEMSGENPARQMAEKPGQ